MALTTTNAQFSIRDGNGAVVNLTSGTSLGLFTPGGTVTFALQSYTGVFRATLKFVCPGYPGLHNQEFDWQSGQSQGWAIQMPANFEVSTQNSLSGILAVVEVSDGQQSIASAFNYLQSKGANGTGFQLYADYVINNALPAYTNVSGVLTGNANGAITSTMADGQTPAVGDTFLLPPGIAAAGVDAGLYVITAVGAAGAKFSAAPAPNWAQGTIISPKTEVLVAKGTVFALSTWVVTNTGFTNAVGTASFTLYPRMVTMQLTLAAGTIALTPVPILSATGKSTIFVERAAAGGTVTSTVMYIGQIGGAGALGTASATAFAAVAAGTVNAADTSNVYATVFNQV